MTSAVISFSQGLRALIVAMFVISWSKDNWSIPRIPAMHWFDVLRNLIWSAHRAKSFELAGMDLVALRKVGEVLFSLACWYTLLQYVPYAVVMALFVVACCAGTWKVLVWCHN